MIDSVEEYLKDLAIIRSSGSAVDETSYYPTLSKLLNSVGKELSPKVTCIVNIQNRGAGLPDMGLFTPDQLRKDAQAVFAPGTLPSRGVVEAKGTQDDAWRTADGQQVAKYLEKYRQVLVTNYRDFVLVGVDSGGNQVRLESFRLADDENSFWASSATPRKTSASVGKRLIDYLKRVMMHSASLADPKEVAWFLASYAREAKARIEGKELPALSTIRQALSESLGFQFVGKEGDHFFRSTLVQTLFYGVFSAWVIWSRQNLEKSAPSRFDWIHAAWSLNLPMIRELFEEIATPSKLGPLQIKEVLDWTEDTLNRVELSSFFGKFQEQNVVQYFYEPFLEEFDPSLRKALGVWFTPHEVVEYMVSRVDTVLRDELGIADGLADPSVVVLDPCCGTGSFLVAILRKIAETLQEKGADALLGNDLKLAAMNRVFGFEILPAPFVVAHLQVGLLLESFGVHLSDAEGERAGIYLTNALTGWQAPNGPQQPLIFPEMDKERSASETVKRKKRIIVVMGNPPYNAFAGVSTDEEQGLVEPYKEGLVSEWKIRKFNLDDPYVRFFRLAERRIVEYSGEGIVCYITNFSYLSEPSYLVMRRRLVKEFDKTWVDCLNGSSRETGKLTPDGKPDPSIFSTEYNKEGIRLGTAICLLVRNPKHSENPAVRFRHFWGVDKRAQLLRALKPNDEAHKYTDVVTTPRNRYSFRPANVSVEYKTWPSITDLCSTPPLNGPVEMRGNSMIVHVADKDKLGVLKFYLDGSKTNEEVSAIDHRLMRSSGEFKAEETRRRLLKKDVHFNEENVLLYAYKPLDARNAYLDADIQPLFSRPAPELLQVNRIAHNSYLVTRDTADKQPEGSPFYYSSVICDRDCISGHARHFPIFVSASKQYGSNQGRSGNGEASETKRQVTLQGEDVVDKEGATMNLSKDARNYLSTLGMANSDADPAVARLIWLHTLAIGYSPAYLSENADGIRFGWPSIPLPRRIEALRESARLGEELAGLVDVGSLHEGKNVLRGAIETAPIAVISKTDRGAIDVAAHDLRVTAGWGHGVGMVMPGSGKLTERTYKEEELVSLQKCCSSFGLVPDDALHRLGEKTFDVFLNEKVFWRNMPAKVWNYTIGGQQVMKKWLSYREFGVLKRDISPDETRTLSMIAKRIASILLLEPSLDASYRRVIGDSYKWPSTIGADQKQPHLT
jgi:hypothetical protein